MNIATGTILEKEEEDFLMNCFSLGKDARNEFCESRLTKKNIQSLENIPNTKKSIKKKSEKKEYDLSKEKVKYLRLIDHVRLRGFDLKIIWAMKSLLHVFILRKEV